jgi:hypothetical protein
MVAAKAERFRGCDDAEWHVSSGSVRSRMTTRTPAARSRGSTRCKSVERVAIGRGVIQTTSGAFGLLLFSLAVALLAGCAGQTSGVGVHAAPTAPTTIAPTPIAPTPITISSGAPISAAFTMPNEIGQILQAAQDDIQRVSGDPIFFSHSHDLLGDRRQVLDRDWLVCAQNAATGTKMSAIAHIDFGVVKLNESCPEPIQPMPEPTLVEPIPGPTLIPTESGPSIPITPTSSDATLDPTCSPGMLAPCPPATDGALQTG